MTLEAGGLAPWRRRDFRIAWAAGLVNNTGDWILLVALPVHIFIETGSGSATAFLFVAQLVAGAIMGPVGGTLVDRWDLKRSLIGTNLAQAIVVLPLLLVTEDQIWPAYIVMGAQSALNQINNPANVALIPRVVTAGELTSANAALRWIHPPRIAYSAVPPSTCAPPVHPVLRPTRPGCVRCPVRGLRRRHPRR